MKYSWICDEEGLACFACGRDIYHCQCEGEGLGDLRQLNTSMKMTLDGTVPFEMEFFGKSCILPNTRLLQAGEASS